MASSLSFVSFFRAVHFDFVYKEEFTEPRGQPYVYIMYKLCIYYMLNYHKVAFHFHICPASHYVDLCLVLFMFLKPCDICCIQYSIIIDIFFMYLVDFVLIKNMCSNFKTS